MLPQSSAIPGWDINPSNFQLFPWLSAIARGFEKYRFHRLSFKFVASNPTTAQGRFYAAVDYDYNDAPATSLSTLMSNETAASGSVWNDVTLTCNMRTMFAGAAYKYVGDTSRFAESEPRTTYGGYLMAAVSGTSSVLTWDLVVSYDVEFISPQHLEESVVEATVDPDERSIKNGVGFFWEAPLLMTQTFHTTKVGSTSLPALSGTDTAAAWTGYDVFGISRLPELTQISLLAADGSRTAAQWVADQGRMMVQLFNAAGAWLGQVEANLAPIGGALAAGCDMLATVVMDWRSVLARYPYATYAGALLFLRDGTWVPTKSTLSLVGR